MSVHRVETPIHRPGLTGRRALWIGTTVVLLLLAIITIYVSIGRATAMPTTDSNANNRGSGAVPGGTLATITNSGSTNTLGFTLTIYNDGSGTLVYKQRGDRRFTSTQDKTFPAGTFAAPQLSTQLKEVGDVSRIPQGGCLKSASFGTRTTITYDGKTSSDLSCPSEKDTPAYKNLRHIVQEMVATAR